MKDLPSQSSTTKNQRQPHHIYLQSNLGIGVRNIDCRGWLQSRAGEEVGRGDVGEEDVVGGAGDIREVLQSYQEEVVEESSHTGEAHLRQDQASCAEQLSGIVQQHSSPCQHQP